MPRIDAKPLDALQRALFVRGLYRTLGIAGLFVIAVVAMMIRREPFPPDQQWAFTVGPIAITLTLVVYEFVAVLFIREPSPEVPRPRKSPARNPPRTEVIRKSPPLESRERRGCLEPEDPGYDPPSDGQRRINLT